MFDAEGNALSVRQRHLKWILLRNTGCKLAFCVIISLMKKRREIFTGRVPRVDDAQGSGVAVLPGLVQRALQLADVQAPALLFIKVIVDLHGAQFCQCSRVQGILRYGDHDAGAGCTFATHQQLQHGLKEQDRKGQGKSVSSTV